MNFFLVLKVVGDEGVRKRKEPKSIVSRQFSEQRYEREK